MNRALENQVGVKAQILRKGEILWIRGWRGRSTVRCVSGELWVTQSGDRQDYVLAQGERLELGRESLILAEALRDAVVHVE